ncbi:MAG TPA: hypothetical protein VGD69_21965 [Herpetosiphonaceae bacterium]
MFVRPRIRALSLGDLLDESFRLYRSNFITFVAITALIMVPYSLISLVMQWPLQTQLTELQNQPSGSNPFGTQSPFAIMGQFFFWYAILIVVSLLYTVVFQPLLEGALAHSIAQRYLSREIGVGSSFGMALRHAPALIGARLIPVLIGALFAGIFIGGGMLLAGVIIGQSINEEFNPDSFGAIIGLGMLGFAVAAALTLIGLALMLRIMFTSQAVIVENAGPLQALMRSWRLTQGSFWRILGYAALIWLMVSFLAALPASAIGFFAGLTGLDPRIQLVLNTSAGAILNVIATPFSMIAYTLLYFDLRVRNEGFDLEYQANALLPGTMDMSAFESR